MPKVVASIEARMGSSRFPGKVLADVAGRPALAWVLERLRQSTALDELVLATTDTAADDALDDWAAEASLPVHRGSEEDVLQRVVDAQASRGSEVVVEVTGDCILLDPELIDVGVATFLGNDCDIVSSAWKPSYPNGVNVQVFRLSDLAEVARTVDDPVVREHVSLYFYEHPERYRPIHLFAPPSCCAPDLRLSLDYPEDLELIRAVYDRLLPRFGERFRTADIVRLLRDEEPALAEINRDCAQRTAR